MKKTIFLALILLGTFPLHSSFVVFLNKAKLRTLLNESIENCDQTQSFEDDVREESQAVAEEMEASGVVDTDCAWPYVNSKYDITHQVADALSKKYSQHKPNIPSFVSQCGSDEELLYQSIINGSVEYMRHAIQNGANINLIKNGKTFIFWAIIFQQKEPVEALIL